MFGDVYRSEVNDQELVLMEIGSPLWKGSEMVARRCIVIKNDRDDLSLYEPGYMGDWSSLDEKNFWERAD